MLFYSLSIVKYIPYLIGIILLFGIVCQWRIFSKMNLWPWLSLVPVVSDFLIFKRCWRVLPFVVLAVLTAVLALYAEITG